VQTRFCLFSLTIPIQLKEVFVMRTSLHWLACGLFTLTVASTTGVTTSFQQIPNAQGANDMSPNGRWIVGETNQLEPYRYDAFTDTMILLGAPGLDASAVSDDGSVVLGSMIDGAGDEVAGIWRSSTGQWQSLGYLPGAGQCPSRSNGYELSADGTVAVGLSWIGCSGRGFRWTQATGMVELQALANGANRASVCSADGNVIGGFAQGSFSRTPSWWTG
jgi:uncharacterized membrane protein